MDTNYVVMIVTAGIFGFLLLLFLAARIDSFNEHRRFERMLFRYYAAENLDKMEYDISYYNENAQEEDTQLTMDELLNASAPSPQVGNNTLTKPIEDASAELLVGNYNPDKE